MIQKYLNTHVSLHYRWERFQPRPPAPPATVRTNAAGKLALWKGGIWLLYFLDADTDASWEGADGSGRKVLGGFRLSCWCWKLTVSWALSGSIRGFPCWALQGQHQFPLKLSNMTQCISVAATPSLTLLFSRGPFYTEPSVKSPTMFPGVLLSRIETGSILSSQDSCIFDPLSEGGTVTSKM